MRKYRIREIPAENIGKGEFEAPDGWELFNIWVGPDGKTYAVLERFGSSY